MRGPSQSAPRVRANDKGAAQKPPQAFNPLAGRTQQRIVRSGECFRRCRTVPHQNIRHPSENSVSMVFTPALLLLQTGGEGIAHVASASGCAWVLRDLLRQRPAMVEELSNGGSTALHCAAESSCDGAVECVQALLDAGAAIEALESDGSTPLHCGAGVGNEAVVRLLLSRGARVDARASGRHGHTPLFDAVGGDHVSCTRALIKLGGADVNATDDVRASHSPTQPKPSQLRTCSGYATDPHIAYSGNVSEVCSPPPCATPTGGEHSAHDRLCTQLQAGCAAPPRVGGGRESRAP